MKNSKKDKVLYMVDSSEFNLKSNNSDKLLRENTNYKITNSPDSEFQISGKNEIILIDSPQMFFQTLQLVQKKMGIDFFK